MRVSPAMYGHITHMLMSLAGGKVAAVLEVRLALFALRQRMSPSTLREIPLDCSREDTVWTHWPK